MGTCFSNTKDMAEDIIDDFDDIKELGENIKETVESVVNNKPISEIVDNIKEIGETTKDIVR